MLLSFLPIRNSPPDQPYTYDDVERQVMLLQLCLQMAQAVPAARDELRTATTACGRFDAGATVKVTHSSSGYRGTVTSKIHKASKPKLVVSCRRSGSGLLFKARPRKRGQTFARGGGPHAYGGVRQPDQQARRHQDHVQGQVASPLAAPRPARRPCL